MKENGIVEYIPSLDREKCGPPNFISFFINPIDYIKYSLAIKNHSYWRIMFTNLAIKAKTEAPRLVDPLGWKKKSPPWRLVARGRLSSPLVVPKSGTESGLVHQTGLKKNLRYRMGPSRYVKVGWNKPWYITQTVTSSWNIYHFVRHWNKATVHAIDWGPHPVFKFAQFLHLTALKFSKKKPELWSHHFRGSAHVGFAATTVAFASAPALLPRAIRSDRSQPVQRTSLTRPLW